MTAPVMLYADDGKVFTITEDAKIGRGGQAVIYKSGRWALKAYLFRDPSDVATGGSTWGVPSAVSPLLELYERRLPYFPQGLMPGLVAPVSLLRDADGVFVGYYMSYIGNSVRLSCLLEMVYTGHNAEAEALLAGMPLVPFLAVAIENLRVLLGQVHRAGLVVGDFKPDNVLVARDTATYLVDVDTMGFGGESPLGCTTAFAAPWQFEPGDEKPVHMGDIATDWYAYNLMCCASQGHDGVFEQGPCRPCLQRQLLRRGM